MVNIQVLFHSDFDQFYFIKWWMRAVTATKTLNMHAAVKYVVFLTVWHALMLCSRHSIKRTVIYRKREENQEQFFILTFNWTWGPAGGSKLLSVEGVMILLRHLNKKNCWDSDRFDPLLILELHSDKKIFLWYYLYFSSVTENAAFKSWKIQVWSQCEPGGRKSLIAMWEM